MIKYTIKEAMEQLGVSRATLYNRLNELEDCLDTCLTFEKGKRYINTKGIDILRKNELLDSCKPKTVELDTQKTDKESNTNIELELLKKENENLMAQLDKQNTQMEKIENEVNNKNNQINELIEAVRESRESVREAHKLNENNQMLLRQSQQRVLLLESEEQKQKGFWKRIFKN